MLFLSLWAVATVIGIYTTGVLKIVGLMLLAYFAGRLMATKLKSEKAVDIHAYSQLQKNIAEANEMMKSSMWWRVMNFGGTGDVKNIPLKELIENRTGILLCGFVTFLMYFHRDLLFGNRVDHHTLIVEFFFEAFGSASAFVCASGILLNLKGK